MRRHAPPSWAHCRHPRRVPARDVGRTPVLTPLSIEENSASAFPARVDHSNCDDTAPCGAAAAYLSFQAAANAFLRRHAAPSLPPHESNCEHYRPVAWLHEYKHRKRSPLYCGLQWGPALDRPTEQRCVRDDLARTSSGLLTARTTRICARAVIVALVVGTVLNLINQGGAILAGAPVVLWKIALTYIVPFIVSTHGALTAGSPSKGGKSK